MPKFYAVFEGELETELWAKQHSSMKEALQQMTEDPDILDNLDDEKENVVLILQVVKRVNIQRAVKISELELEEPIEQTETKE
jgi:hypothetical protein